MCKLSLLNYKGLSMAQTGNQHRNFRLPRPAEAGLAMTLGKDEGGRMKDESEVKSQK